MDNNELIRHLTYTDPHTVYYHDMEAGIVEIKQVTLVKVVPSAIMQDDGTFSPHTSTRSPTRPTTW